MPCLARLARLYLCALTQPCPWRLCSCVAVWLCGCVCLVASLAGGLAPSASPSHRAFVSPAHTTPTPSPPPTPPPTPPLCRSGGACTAVLPHARTPLTAARLCVRRTRTRTRTPTPRVLHACRYDRRLGRATSPPNTRLPGEKWKCVHAHDRQDQKSEATSLISLDFVSLSARTEGPHGGASCVQVSKRNRIGRRSWIGLTALDGNYTRTFSYLCMTSNPDNNLRLSCMLLIDTPAPSPAAPPSTSTS